MDSSCMHLEYGEALCTCYLTSFGREDAIEFFRLLQITQCCQLSRPDSAMPR